MVPFACIRRAKRIKTRFNMRSKKKCREGKRNVGAHGPTNRTVTEKMAV
jgi:hypothetical protein